MSPGERNIRTSNGSPNASHLHQIEHSEIFAVVVGDFLRDVDGC